MLQPKDGAGVVTLCSTVIKFRWLQRIKSQVSSQFVKHWKYASHRMPLSSGTSSWNRILWALSLTSPFRSYSGQKKMLENNQFYAEFLINARMWHFNDQLRELLQNNLHFSNKMKLFFLQTQEKEKEERGYFSGAGVSLFSLHHFLNPNFHLMHHMLLKHFEGLPSVLRKMWQYFMLLPLDGAKIINPRTKGPLINWSV